MDHHTNFPTIHPDRSFPPPPPPVSGTSCWWRYRTETRSCSTVCWPLTSRSSCPSCTRPPSVWRVSSTASPSGDHGECLQRGVTHTGGFCSGFVWVLLSGKLISTWTAHFWFPDIPAVFRSITKPPIKSLIGCTTPPIVICSLSKLLVYRGLFITIHDKGHIASVLNSWPEEDIKVCRSLYTHTHSHRHTHTHNASLCD